MRFAYAFIGFGVLAGATLAFLGPLIPAQLKVFPPLLWLLASVLLFDIITAYVRGVPVMQSVSTNTRVIAFIGGAVVMMLLGGLWS